MTASISRAQALSFRVRAQQLDRQSGTLSDTAVLDIGVQDTGPDGGLWALALRGVDVETLPREALATVWTVRGAPHLYRRPDLPAVAAAVAPFSDADAAKRIYDAAKPLKAAGIGTLQALDAVAAAMRSVVSSPLVKGEVSTQVTALMAPPYLRYCRPCDATHLYEMPFRLAALRAGLELQAGTSPPVLQRIPDFVPLTEPPERFDVVRAYLRFLGPATPQQVAGYLDAPVAEVRARWPRDAVEVKVAGSAAWLLAEDLDAASAGGTGTTRLLGPFDLLLQARDRSTLVDDPARVKALWPVLGRPGGVLLDDEVAGTWRAKRSRAGVRVQVQLWSRASAAARAAIGSEAERLAAHRGLKLDTFEVND
ncbi:MAG TPA: crosslink repair DNA glycosylase YcaQ family protein [Actinomycetales bacterium]|nr:crosslink repair DNA glycosylase YcaQ family protein [Actinomycetales bacterium]